MNRRSFFGRVCAFLAAPFVAKVAAQSRSPISPRGVTGGHWDRIIMDDIVDDPMTMETFDEIRPGQTFPVERGVMLRMTDSGFVVTNRGSKPAWVAFGGERFHLDVGESRAATALIPPR